jgi:hypothetical protein
MFGRRSYAVKPTLRAAIRPDSFNPCSPRARRWSGTGRASRRGRDVHVTIACVAERDRDRQGAAAAVIVDEPVVLAVPRTRMPIPAVRTARSALQIGLT